MTITTDVRINWPVPAVALLDYITRVAGGDPATVRRAMGDDLNLDRVRNYLMNLPAQGLRTLASVEWGEAPDTGDEDWPAPPALVVLSLDNPYGGASGPSGREVQALEILPAVAEWLDDQGVPRDRWWWEDECAGTFHPGDCDVRQLLTSEPRPIWIP